MIVAFGFFCPLHDHGEGGGSLRPPGATRFLRCILDGCSARGRIRGDIRRVRNDGSVPRKDRRGGAHLAGRHFWPVRRWNQQRQRRRAAIAPAPATKSSRPPLPPPPSPTPPAALCTCGGMAPGRGGSDVATGRLGSVVRRDVRRRCFSWAGRFIILKFSTKFQQRSNFFTTKNSIFFLRSNFTD